MKKRRDIFGVTPLYYTKVGEELIVSSDINSLLNCREPEIDHEALYNYLVFRYNPLEKTLFKGIYKVPPAHTIEYNGTITKKRYWNLKITPQRGGEEFFKQGIVLLLRESILRLYRENPSVGIMISGGLDSGSLVALLSEESKEPVKTFSVGFMEEGELEDARFLAEYYGTEHRDFIMYPGDMKVLPKIIRWMGLPLGDPALVPMYLSASKAKNHVKCVFSGDGSDEQFVSYERAIFLHKGEEHRKLALLMKEALKYTPKTLLDRFFEYSSSLGEQGIRRYQEFAENLGSNRVKSYLAMASIFDEEELSELLKGEPFKIDLSDHIKDEGNAINQVTAYEFETRLPENLLLKSYGATRPHGVECKFPYLDKDLVEFTQTIPLQYSLTGFEGKQMLRTAMEEILPRKVLEKKKHHFFVPVDSWLNGEIGEWAKQLLDKRVLADQDIFNYPFIEKIFRNYDKSQLYYGRQIWTLLCFQLWYDEYIGGL